MPPVSRRLISTGVVGAILAIGGFAWFYHQYREFQTHYDSASQAGVNVEVGLPLLPRVLCLTGLLLVLITAIVIVTKRLRQSR